MRRLTDANLMKWTPFGHSGYRHHHRRWHRLPQLTHNILATHQSCTGSHTVITHHNVDKFCDGVNERPDPLAVDLWLDGAGRRANGQTPRALLGVHLHKIRAQSRCFGWQPSGRTESLASNSHVFSTTRTLIPKNSRKCHVSVVAAPTRCDTRF